METSVTTLNILISSFSYKKGLPQDNTEHGGGFVFDCRWIDNPGRLDDFKTSTGAEQIVQEFLLQKTDMPIFLSQIKELLKAVITKYQTRKFVYLSINFGCTGGQHRSVFAAINIQTFINENFANVIIKIQHREQPQLNK